jgi:hypothetical protein
LDTEIGRKKGYYGSRKSSNLGSPLKYLKAMQSEKKGGRRKKRSRKSKSSVWIKSRLDIARQKIIIGGLGKVWQRIVIYPNELLTKMRENNY